MEEHTIAIKFETGKQKEGTNLVHLRKLDPKPIVTNAEKSYLHHGHFTKLQNLL